MEPFTGKVALITGSGRGMGRAHALLLAERGADIVVHDILEDGAEETARLVRETGRRAMVAIADVGSPARMAEVVKSAEDTLGSVDVLINNAGVSAERFGLEEVDEAHYTRMFDVHVKGTFFTTRAVVPGMKARGHGKIVNISSIWAMKGHHFGSTYCGAKAAILGLTKAWAREFAPFRICVNAVAPGGVRTPMQVEADGMEKVLEDMKKVPLGRYAEPEEMAYAVVFLASPESDFITGQVLSPNGGDTIVGI